MMFYKAHKPTVIEAVPRNLCIRRERCEMKRLLLLLIIAVLITGCSNGSEQPSQTDIDVNETEIEPAFERSNISATLPINDGSTSESIIETPENTAELSICLSPEEEELYQQFFKDAYIPEMIHDLFIIAIFENYDAQKLLFEHARQGVFEIGVLFDVFPYLHRDIETPYTEYECMLNIGTAYLAMDNRSDIGVDVEKAYSWFNLFASKASTGSEGEILEYGEYSVTPFTYVVTNQINDDLPIFEFTIEGVLDKTGNSSYYPGTIRVHTITISSMDGSIKQVFTNLSTRLYEVITEKDMYGLSFDDWNFDGYQDIGLHKYHGGTSHNVPHYYWLWDNDSKQFVANKQLEEISDGSDIQTDNAKNQLSCYTRIVPDGYLTRNYEYRNSEYVMVRSEEVMMVRVEEVEEEMKDIRFILHTVIEELIDDEMTIIEDDYEDLTEEYWENANSHSEEVEIQHITD